MIYDDEEAQRRFEPKHRLVRVSVGVFFFVAFSGRLCDCPVVGWV